MPLHPPGTFAAEQKARYPEGKASPPELGSSATAPPDGMSPERWRRLAEVEGEQKSVRETFGSGTAVINHGTPDPLPPYISISPHPPAPSLPAASGVPPPAPSSSPCQSHDIRQKPGFENKDKQAENSDRRQENWKKWTAARKQAKDKTRPEPTPQEAAAEARAREGIEQHIAATQTADPPPPPPLPVRPLPPPPTASVPAEQGASRARAADASDPVPGRGRSASPPSASRGRR